MNTGKNSAEEVHFRSFFCPLSDPNRLKQASDVTAANTIYSGYPFNPWVQIWVEDQQSSDLSKIKNLILFYYCRLDYRDALAPSVSYSQDFYFIYNIGRKKLQDATLEIKEKFRPQIEKLILPVSNINNLTDKPVERRTQLRPLIKKRVNELYDEINNEKLKPWVSFHIIPFQVTRHDGSVMSFRGVKFEGAPRNAFWMDGFIPPILENAIVKAFDQTTEECRANSIDPEPHLFETNLILGDLIIRVYNRMAGIDKRLRGKGFPEKDVQDEINKMNENLKRYYKAALFLASEINTQTKAHFD